MQDPETSAAVMDEMLTRQFTAIGEGLTDACPHVRAAAATGICGLLNTFWELIPAPISAGFLKRLTSDCSTECNDVATQMNNLFR